MRTFIATIVAAATLALVAPAAFAQPARPTPEKLELARQAYARGAAAFDKKDFETAIEAFKESYRLSRNPLLLYNIGVTLEELGDKKLALFYYRKFLTDAPRDVKNRDEAARSAAALAAELEGKAPAPDTSTGDETAGSDSEPAAAATSATTQFQHNVVGEAPPGKPLDITAFAPQGVGLTVYLYYRSGGASEFTRVEMKPRYQELVGRIPASKVSGSSLQYYVEARDVGDEVVHRSGKAVSPHIVLLDAAAKPRYYPDFGDDGSAGAASSPADGRDTGSTDMMTYARWGATGGALGLVALSATFIFIAQDASSAIEGEAFESAEQDSCPEGRPCRTFDETKRDLEARGKRFELLGNVSLALAVGAGVTAGVLWYLHGKDKKKAQKLSAAPAVGRDFVGAAAQVRF